MPDLFAASDAIFSDCRRYRYRLWRTFGEGGRAVFVMLNPSTADEIQNDPTVERCQRRAVAMGFGRLDVVNIFAYRATQPRELRTAHSYKNCHPVGPDNDRHILEACDGAGMVICAWGTHGRFMERGGKVRALLRDAGVPLHVLALTKDGHPQHPLYIGYDRKPERWT